MSETIVLRNMEMAGWLVTPPHGGKTLQFDEQGLATCPADCGLHLVRGYTLVEGTPKELVTEAGDVRLPDGPLVTCLWPAMAGMLVACPDGHTTASFDAAGRARVPNTCGLDLHNGASYVDEQAPPPQEAAPLPTAPAIHEMLAVGLEPRLVADKATDLRSEVKVEDAVAVEKVGKRGK